MIRLILSVLIVTALITYLLTHVIKYYKPFGKKELKRIDGVFNSNKQNNDEKSEENK